MDSAWSATVTFIPGIVRGLAMALQVFTDKGDKVLIQQPVYHPFRIIIEGNCRKVVRNPLRFCDDGHVEMDFEPARAPVCRGASAHDDSLQSAQPRRICMEPRGAWHVLPTSAPNTACWWRATKSTATLSLFGNRYTPFASVSDAAAQCSVTFGAPSKTFNIAGIVSSWCVVKNPALRRKFFTWLTVNEYNVPTFVQTVLPKPPTPKRRDGSTRRCATSRTTSATRSNFWRSGYHKSVPCARRRRSSYGSTARHWD